MLSCLSKHISRIQPQALSLMIIYIANMDFEYLLDLCYKSTELLELSQVFCQCDNLTLHHQVDNLKS